MRGSALPLRLAIAQSNPLVRFTLPAPAAIAQQAPQQAAKSGLTSSRLCSALSHPLGHQLNYIYVRQPLRQSWAVFRGRRSALVQWQDASSRCRLLSTKAALYEAPRSIANVREKEQSEEKLSDDEGQGFARSEKAARAAQVDLSARLNKDGLSHGHKPGVFDVWRLLRIARPEAKYLGGTRIYESLIRVEGY
jgi:hypothetical protein